MLRASPPTAACVAPQPPTRRAARVAAAAQRPPCRGLTHVCRSSRQPPPAHSREELEALLAQQEALVEALQAQLTPSFRRESGSYEHELVIFTGGTGFNSLCAELKRYTTHVAHVLPVSDDGGSTAEIVRVLGGPAVGDIRSRCLRLADESNEEARAVKSLLGHRLPSDPAAAKAEWYSIVEGEHALWAGMSEPYKNTVRSFLAHFHFQLVRLGSDGEKPFCFSGGSVGNFFFAGTRIFFRSLDAAVFLFSRVSGIPPRSAVLPIVSTNGRLVLGAELESGEMLRGQSDISHPSPPAEEGEEPHPTVLAAVSKGRGSSAELPLPSPVRRVLYLSTEETDELHEVFPRVNPAVLQRVGSADAVVYGVGSLWSSIAPSLIPAGVGEAVAARDCAKVLLLNGSRDRETTGMGVADICRAIASSLNRQHAKVALSRGARPLGNPLGDYLTTVLAPQGCDFDLPAAQQELQAQGIQLVTVPSELDDHGRVVFEPRALVAALRTAVAQRRAFLASKVGYVI